MRYTKSDMVLALTENIYEQQDVALVERVLRGFGLDFLDEAEFTDDDLENIVMNEVGFLQQLGQSFNPWHGAKALVGGAGANAAPGAAAAATTAPAAGVTHHGGVGDLAHQAAGHIATGVRAVGSTVTGGLQGAATAAGAPAGGAVHTALGHMAANPGMVGAAALGLGAAAALRMRSNMKARAAARMSGVR